MVTGVTRRQKRACLEFSQPALDLFPLPHLKHPLIRTVTQGLASTHQCHRDTLGMVITTLGRTSMCPFHSHSQLKFWERPSYSYGLHKRLCSTICTSPEFRCVPIGTPHRIRTCNLSVRSRMHYPVVLTEQRFGPAGRVRTYIYTDISRAS